MWREQVKAEGKAPFWELLKLVGKHRMKHEHEPRVLEKEGAVAYPDPPPHEDRDGEEDDEEESSDDEQYCVYCPQSFGSTHFMDQHMKFCAKKYRKKQ